MSRARGMWWGLLALIALGGVTLLGVAARRSALARAQQAAVPLTVLHDVTMTRAGAVPRSAIPADGGAIWVVSSTCVHCRKLLTDLAAAAPDDSFPALSLLFLDGAPAGDHLLARLGLRVAAYEIAGDRAASLRALRIDGTPTLIGVTATGQETVRFLGAPNARELASWLAVLRGAGSATGRPVSPVTR